MTYFNKLSAYLMGYEREAERAIAEFVAMTDRCDRIFIAGNGGSSSIASHACVDLMKIGGIKKVHCLSDNVPTLTALANDLDYSHAFSTQLRFHDLKEDDAVVLVSSSGNSSNVVRAAEYSYVKKSWLFCLVGFEGGELKKMADERNGAVVFHVPSEDYGIVEDCHAAFFHGVTSTLRDREMGMSL